METWVTWHKQQEYDDVFQEFDSWGQNIKLRFLLRYFEASVDGHSPKDISYVDRWELNSSPTSLYSPASHQYNNISPQHLHHSCEFEFK